MNLIKYFNFKFLKENIKKSKGLIILLLIAVPLFTILSLVFLYNESNTARILNQAEVAIPNVIGMYLIPYVLSVALFEYIYKKSSVDLINSMPINRKTIFITNTIGGILLITLMQIITLIISLVCNSLISSIVIFPQMLIDIFITMWIAYFFVFCATNLAMSLSGTVLTQLVLTMIIIFIIPFCMVTFKMLIQNTDESVNYENVVFNLYEQSDEYTLPSNVILGNMSSLYSTVSNTKMLVLGIIYLILGLYLFQKRKMENAEESFGNNKSHLFVKALTVFPMIVILNLLELDKGMNIFVLSLIVIYYFVYDFLIKRKIKFWVSVIALILTLGISQLIVSGIQNIKIENDIDIQKENIEAIEIDWDYQFFTGSRKVSKELLIDNKEIIDTIYNAAKEGAETEKKYIDSSEVNTEYVPMRVLFLDIILKDGKRYNAIVSVKEEDFEKIVELLEKDKEYVENIKADLITYGVFSYDRKAITEKNDELNKLLEESIKEITLKDISNMNYNFDYVMSFTKVIYKDHNIFQRQIPLNINKDILQIVGENQNKSTKELWKNIKENSYMKNSFYLEAGSLGYNTEEFEDFDGQFIYSANTIRNFLDNNIDEKYDSKQKTYILRVYSPDIKDTIYFFTNKVNEINEIIKLEVDQKDFDITDYVDTEIIQ